MSNLFNKEQKPMTCTTTDSQFNLLTPELWNIQPNLYTNFVQSYSAGCNRIVQYSVVFRISVFGIRLTNYIRVTKYQYSVRELFTNTDIR